MQLFQNHSINFRYCMLFHNYLCTGMSLKNEGEIILYDYPHSIFSFTYYNYFITKYISVHTYTLKKTYFDFITITFFVYNILKYIYSNDSFDIPISDSLEKQQFYDHFKLHFEEGNF